MQEQKDTLEPTSDQPATATPDETPADENTIPVLPKDSETPADATFPGLPEDKTAMILELALFSSLDQLPQTFSSLSQLSHAFNTSLQTNFDREFWLKKIPRFAELLKIDLNRMNLDNSTTDQHIIDTGKAISTLFGISLRLSSLQRMHIRYLPEAKPGTIKIVTGYGENPTEIFAICTEYFSALKTIATKFASCNEILISALKLTTELAITYLYMLSNAINEVSNLQADNLTPHYLLIGNYMSSATNHISNLLQAREIKACSLCFVTIAKVKVVLTHKHYFDVAKIFKGFDVKHNRALPLLVNQFTPLEILAQQNHPAGLQLFRGLNEGALHKFYNFWMVCIDENYTQAKNLYRLLTNNNRLSKLIFTLSFLTQLDFSFSNPLQMLVISFHMLIKDPQNLCQLIDNYGFKHIALLMLLNAFDPGLLNNILAKRPLVALCLDPIIVHLNTPISQEEYRAASKSLLSYCLKAEDPTLSEVIDAVTPGTLTVAQNKFHQFLKERFPNSHCAYPFEIMALSGFPVLCNSVRQLDRCSIWEYIGNKPLQGLLWALIASPALMQDPTLFRKINKLSFAQLQIALTFLFGHKYSVANCNYLRASLEKAHDFFDWIIDYADAKKFATLLPLANFLSMPPSWRKILQSLCIKGPSSKEENLRDRLMGKNHQCTINSKVDEESGHLVMQLLPFLANEPIKDPRIVNDIDRWLYFVIQLSWLSKKALPTLVAINAKMHDPNFLDFIFNYYSAYQLKMLLSATCQDPSVAPDTPAPVLLIEALFHIRNLRDIHDLAELMTRDNPVELLQKACEHPAIVALVKHLKTNSVPEDLLRQFSTNDICDLYETSINNRSLFEILFYDRSQEELIACNELFRNIRQPGSGDEDDDDDDNEDKESSEEEPIKDLRNDTPEIRDMIFGILSHYSHLLIQLNTLYICNFQELLFDFSYTSNTELARRVMHSPALSKFLLSVTFPSNLFNDFDKLGLWPQLISFSSGSGFARLCTIMPVHKNPLLCGEFLCFAAQKETQVNLTLLEWLMTTQAEAIDCLFALFDINHYQQRQISLQRMGEAFITDLQTRQILYSIMHPTVSYQGEENYEKRRQLLQQIIDDHQPESLVKPTKPDDRRTLVNNICKFSQQFTNKTKTDEFFTEHNTRRDLRSLRKQMATLMENLKQYAQQLPEDPDLSDSEDEQKEKTF